MEFFLQNSPFLAPMRLASTTLRSSPVMVPPASKVRSSSNKVFRIADLLDIIASMIDMPSLPSFVQVDSMCFEAGRRYIWEVVPSAFYILHLLPFFTCQDNIWSISLSAHPAPWEWSRFDIYAPCIQEFISLSSSTVVGDHDINSRTFLNICYLRPDKFKGAPIFPNLRKLRFRGSGLYSNTGPSKIDYLITDRLEEAEIHVQNSVMSTYLRNLRPAVTSLRKLVLEGRVSAGVLSTLAEFLNIESLTITAIYDTTQDQRCISPLICNFLDTFPANMSPTHLVLQTHIPRPLSLGALACVKYLELNEGSSTFIHVLRAGSFERVTLSFTEVELISSFHACFEALAKGSLHTLQSVTVYTRADFKHDFPTLHCLGPLLDLPKLQELCIHHSDKLNIVVGDEDLVRMVAAWPSLRRLVLLPSPLSVAYRDIQQQPSFHGVVALMGLPKMESFAVRAENTKVNVRFPLSTDVWDGLKNLPRPLREYIQRCDKRWRGRV